MSVHTRLAPSRHPRVDGPGAWGRLPKCVSSIGTMGDPGTNSSRVHTSRDRQLTGQDKDAPEPQPPLKSTAGNRCPGQGGAPNMTRENFKTTVCFCEF